jgi:hypothetical protein
VLGQSQIYKANYGKYRAWCVGKASIGAIMPRLNPSTQLFSVLPGLPCMMSSSWQAFTGSAPFLTNKKSDIQKSVPNDFVELGL